MEHLELHYIVVKDILISSWRNDHKEVVHYKCAIAHMPFYCHTKSNANRRGVRTAYTHQYIIRPRVRWPPSSFASWTSWKTKYSIDIDLNEHLDTWNTRKSSKCIQLAKSIVIIWSNNGLLKWSLGMKTKSSSKSSMNIIPLVKLRILIYIRNISIAIVNRWGKCFYKVYPPYFSQRFWTQRSQEEKLHNKHIFTHPSKLFRRGRKSTFH